MDGGYCVVPPDPSSKGRVGGLVSNEGRKGQENGSYDYVDCRRRVAPPGSSASSGAGILQGGRGPRGLH